MDYPAFVYEPLHPFLRIPPIACDAHNFVLWISFSCTSRPKHIVQLIAAAIWVSVPIKPIDVTRVKRPVLRVEYAAGRLGIEQYAVVHTAKVPCSLPGITFRIRPFPDNLIPEVPITEDRIQQQFQVVTGIWVAVEVDGACWLEDSAELNEAWGHHDEVGHHGVSADELPEGRDHVLDVGRESSGS